MLDSGKVQRQEVLCKAGTIVRNFMGSRELQKGVKVARSLGEIVCGTRIQYFKVR
jgi:osmotically-inducible protein OsmY